VQQRLELYSLSCPGVRQLLIAGDGETLDSSPFEPYAAPSAD